MYSYKSQYPTESLPDRIRLSNGLTRTDKTTYTQEEILDAGYVFVENPPTINMFQKLLWEDQKWLIKDLTAEEKDLLKINQWNLTRQERNQLLEQTDWQVIKTLEQNEPVSQELLVYRQALRDITLQEDPFNIIWPQLLTTENNL